MATLLANKTVMKKSEQLPQERFYKNAKEKQSNLELKSFGEIGIVTKKPGPNIKGKMDNRGEICLFVGYAKNHMGNVYRMYNLRTKKVWLTQDVQWTKKFYGLQKGKKASKVYLELNTFNNELEQEPEENPEEEIKFKSDNNEENILKKLSQIHEEEAKKENVTPV